MKKPQLGASLLELLVGLSAVVAGALLIMGILVSSNNFFARQTIAINQGLSLNQTEMEITSAIKSSSGIVDKYPTSGVGQFVSSPTTLVLQIPSISQSSQVIDSVRNSF